MARNLVIRPKAEKELSEAFGWYENQVQGLGSDYLNTVEASQLENTTLTTSTDRTFL